ncbi:MAG: tripartite tricarboxylate transporter TctB family protein [Deltaproteobacteria bacterium]|nr:tripartite tricarboxylate transporter TctB family protein [Deltaproteobacteria bacterium]
MKRETKDILLSLGLMIFFLLTYLYLVPLGIFVPSSIKIPVMSPAFFPKTVSVLIIILSLILLIQSIILARTHTQKQALDDRGDDNECEADRLIVRKVKIAKIGGAVMLLFLYYGTVMVFGMLPASIVFLLAFSLLYGERRFKITIPLAVMLPVLLYLFFTMVTKIPLPKGILFQ